MKRSELELLLSLLGKFLSNVESLPLLARDVSPTKLLIVRAQAVIKNILFNL